MCVVQTPQLQSRESEFELIFARAGSKAKQKTRAKVKVHKFRSKTKHGNCYTPKNGKNKKHKSFKRQSGLLNSTR
jgi:hypothetical protein